MTELLIFLLGAMSVSFLCSILEASLMSTPISFITLKEEEGLKAATRLKRYKQDSSRPLAAILSLNTIANTIGAAGVGRQATLIFGSAWFGVVSAVTTILILIFSEIIPKTIGTSHWKSLTGFTASAIHILIIILFPIVVSVEFLQKLISRTKGDVGVSREEIGAMADVAEQTGELEQDENEIIQNIINIDEISAKEAMTPRVVAAIAPEAMTIKKFYKDRRFLHHSRIPVYADNDEYITGYILRMDALQLMAEDKFDSKLSEIKRTIASFPEDTTVDRIWDEMLKSKEQIVVIIDEYGSFRGLLTMEDIIETVLGNEIVDERDVVVDMQKFAMDKWNKRAKRNLLGCVLAFLGFASTTSCDPASLVKCEYGMPIMDFEVSGKVVDQADAPIAGISVSCSSRTEKGFETVNTDADGKFSIAGSSISAVLEFKDIDGAENGGEFEEMTREIKVKQVEKGDGWYMGKFRADDVLIRMKEKE